METARAQLISYLQNTIDWIDDMAKGEYCMRCGIVHEPGKCLRDNDIQRV